MRDSLKRTLEHSRPQRICRHRRNENNCCVVHRKYCRNSAEKNEIEKCGTYRIDSRAGRRSVYCAYKFCVLFRICFEHSFSSVWIFPRCCIVFRMIIVKWKCGRIRILWKCKRNVWSSSDKQNQSKLNFSKHLNVSVFCYKYFKSNSGAKKKQMFSMSIHSLAV